ncbi:uncharacterized protein VICG_01449 [Vittaforma corneae ATCC 50505]|uniref:Uncharacterized protein n=1 Tax=Vittaforma corneae (strain ATCC 50505) TaxID=993615 RepID=L2GLT4_VITCO|nr:uncharacterized protein VICG_01449 [Vittaforma corneae ATCC 50505]ELA41465.1 hypothetical protein VICG_01449 [Vittaforma corneae ATCC 50505]
MTEVKRIKAGSFKTMGLHPQLLKNIPFDNPTPIQRKTVPLVMEGRSLMGIARTGSGKTLCYLIPVIMNAINNQNSLILLPTKELVLQVKSIFKILSNQVPLTGTVVITTLKSMELKDISLLVVDEIDRILEEPSLNAFFESISEKVACQKVYFSATLPDEPLDIPIVQVESKIPEHIQNYFFYVPSESKENALLNILDRTKKTIVFVATRYGVEFLLAVLEKFSYKAKGIYSSMDDDARKESFGEFMSGKIKILVVTDVAARGLDIPHLDVSISYDLSDEKTFVHRVGRVRGMGEQYSLVTYSDVFHFFNIKETHLNSVEIGTIPQNLLDKYDLSDLDHLKYLAMRGYQRCLDFRRKVSVPAEFKSLVESFEVHSKFKIRNTLADELKKMKAKKIESSKQEEVSFKDQFYIPYSKNERRTHCSAFSVAKDDYVKERRPRQRPSQRIASKPKS